jgi:hypothetical protein
VKSNRSLLRQSGRHVPAPTIEHEDSNFPPLGQKLTYYFAPYVSCCSSYEIHFAPSLSYCLQNRFEFVAGEDGRRAPLKRGRQCRSFWYFAESQAGHPRQQLMGDGYPEKQVWNKQEADCGICEVGMRNQKQHKAEDDTNRNNMSP